LLVYDAIRKSQDAAESNSLRPRFLREIHANISFCILISILAIVTLLIAPLWSAPL
jgi:hypothetical protein